MAIERVAVLGAGSWGTTFAKVIADSGPEVVLWARRQEVASTITETRVNADYLPGISLPANLTATSDPAKALDGADAVVLAVPSQTLRVNLSAWKELLPPDATLVSLSKGVELGTLKRMSEVVADVAGLGPERIAVLTGPNLSHEVASRQPAASVVACADEKVAEHLQARCHTPALRLYSNTDVVGCELGGATKNVIALAVGMAHGLGFGDNSTATVITRGLAEIARLGEVLGADPYTFSGLAGLGDLVATCSSPLSRNRSFGEKLGQGMSVEEIAASTRQVAEGVKSCESIKDLARLNGVEMPIVEAVAALVRGETTPHEMLQALVSRATKPERS